MKLIIAGGRDYHFSEADVAHLDSLLATMPIDEVVTGAATGADRCGSQWARSRGLPVREFPADWDRYGRQAGPIRNRAMANYADAVILFPGKQGTLSMRTEANRAGLIIVDRSRWQ